MSKHLVRIGVAVLSTLLAILVLWQFRTIVAYVLVSLMLAATIRPMFRRLAGRSLTQRMVWILAYVILLGGVASFSFSYSKLRPLRSRNSREVSACIINGCCQYGQAVPSNR